MEEDWLDWIDYKEHMVNMMWMESGWFDCMMAEAYMKVFVDMD